jgi:hypothetical protein
MPQESTDHSILKMEAPAPWTQQPGRKSKEVFCDEQPPKYCKPYPFVQSASLAVYDGQDRIGSIAEHDGEHVTLTPLEAVRRKCLWCCNGSTHEVALCPARACPSWPFRFGRKPSAEIIADQANTPLHPLEWPMTAADFHAERHPALHAIKRKCLDCSGASKSEVRNCAFKDRALHPFRQGENPNRTYSPDERATRSQHLAKLKSRRPLTEKPVSIGDPRTKSPRATPIATASAAGSKRAF